MNQYQVDPSQYKPIQMTSSCGLADRLNMNNATNLDTVPEIIEFSEHELSEFNLYFAA